MLSVYGTHAPASVLTCAAFVKYRLNKPFAETEGIWQAASLRTLAEMEQPLLRLAGLVSVKFSKYEQALGLFELSSLNATHHLEILGAAAHTYDKLDRCEQAHILYTWILKKNVPLSITFQQRADEFYTRMLAQVLTPSLCGKVASELNGC